MRLKKESSALETSLWDQLGEAGLAATLGGCRFSSPKKNMTLQMSPIFDDGTDFDDDDESDFAVFEMHDGQVSIFETTEGSFFWSITGIYSTTPMIMSLMFRSPWADENKNAVSIGGFENTAFDAAKRALAAFERLKQWINEMPVDDMPVIAHKNNPLVAEYESDDDSQNSA